MHKLVCAVVAALLLLSAAPASANQYEIFIDVENEEDLYDLLASRQIGDDTFNTLLELFQRGVDLNTATRDQLYALPNLTYPEIDAILLYRKQAGFISDPAVLAQMNVLSTRRFIAIAAFLIIKGRKRAAYATNGRLRAQTVWTAEDDRVPATSMLVRLSTLKHLKLSVLSVISRNRVGSPVFDPNRNALLADGPKTRLHIPKFYAQWDDDNVNVIVGNFTAGFGEGLVFDKVSRPRPNGLYPDDSHRRETNDLSRKCRLSSGELSETPCDTDVYVTPDFKWTDYLQGVGVGLKNVKIGDGFAQAYGFVSYQAIDVYQYKLYDAGQCTDPQDDSNAACSSPDVFNLGSNALAPSAKHSFQTLPNIMRELVVGGNVAYRPHRRVQFGITGYGAKATSLASGIDLDFQEWAGQPFGGPYGALGMNAAVGSKWLDVFVEVAHSFDSMEDGGGGLAGVARAVASRKKEELEFSLRYYDTKYANPFSGSRTQAFPFDGNRQRNQAGARLSYANVIQKKLRLRSTADIWQLLNEDIVMAELKVRADIDASKIFGYGLWVEYDNRNIDSPFEIVCSVSTAGDVSPDGSASGTTSCNRQFKLTPRIRWTPHKKVRLAAQYTHNFAGRPDGTFRQDVSTWFTMFAKVSPEFSVNTRVRYVFEDISNNSKLEQSFLAYANLRYRIQKKQWFNIRYDVRRRIDDRQSTLDRVPRTESWVWAQYEAKF